MKLPVLFPVRTSSGEWKSGNGSVARVISDDALMSANVCQEQFSFVRRLVVEVVLLSKSSEGRRALFCDHTITVFEE